MLGAGSEDQWVFETLIFEIAQQVLIRTQTGGGVSATVPLIEYEGESTPAALVKEQVPTQLVVVLFLGADVKDHIGDGEQAFQLFAVGDVVAVQVRRIDED